MEKTVSARSIPLYDASGGFSHATAVGAAAPSSEGDQIQRPQLVAFRGEDRFGIGAGNFAHRNPAESAHQRAN
jgi:hypothetical protein